MPQLLPYGKESQHSLPVRDHSPDLLEGNGSYSKCLKAYPLSDPQHLSLHLYFLLEKKKKLFKPEPGNQLNICSGNLS